MKNKQWLVDKLISGEGKESHLWQFSDILSGEFRLYFDTVDNDIFLNNGQFDTYRSLSEMGFAFDYNIDLSYDQESGDLQRFEKLINLIDSLSTVNTQDLFNMTRKSCLHNQNHVVSDTFYYYCEDINEQSSNDILNSLV
jgi:hypothetical protein